MHGREELVIPLWIYLDLHSPRFLIRSPRGSTPHRERDVYGWLGREPVNWESGCYAGGHTYAFFLERWWDAIDAVLRVVVLMVVVG